MFSKTDTFHCDSVEANIKVNLDNKRRGRFSRVNPGHDKNHFHLFKTSQGCLEGAFNLLANSSKVILPNVPSLLGKNRFHPLRRYPGSPIGDPTVGIASGILCV